MAKESRDIDDVGMRLDKWLWAARFFRTRALAAAAVRSGKVRCEGERVKPARIVRAGVKVTIGRAEETMDVEIVAVSSRRGPAKVAAGLYRESEDSIGRRSERRASRRIAHLVSPDYGKRPDKRGRRRLLRLTGKGAPE